MPRVKAVESTDPEFHRSNLRRFIGSLKRYDRKYGNNYQSFIQKLFGIFQDNPPHSWRFLITTYKYPAFRVVNRKSGRTIYFLRVYEGRLILLHIYFDERFRKLFPIKKGFYGQGDEVVIDFSKFGERKQLEYINAIRSMIENNPSISLNFQPYI